jgi:hypothetical protein
MRNFSAQARATIGTPEGINQIATEEPSRQDTHQPFV